MVLKVVPELSPRLFTVPITDGTTLSMQEAVDQLRDWEDEPPNMSYPRTVLAAGKEDLGGGVSVGITATFQDGQIEFEERTTPVSSGTATGADATGTILTDGSATFEDDLVLRGAWIVNFADQSVSTVLTVDSQNQITHKALIEGSGNDWGIGDAYKIWNIIQVELDGGNAAAIDSAGSPISPVYTSFGNQVVRTSSSSATIVETGISGLTAEEAANLADIHGQVRREIWIDTSLVSNGDGYQQTPYNNLTDAVDDAEANGITSLVLLDDITLDRNLKNFNVRGVGVPTIDFAGFDLKSCRFFQVKAEGTYTEEITMQDCVLLTGCFLNGFFENCALAGDLTCVNGANVFVKSCASIIPGTGRPTISMSAAGTSQLSVRDHGGGLTITDCNNVADDVTVEMGQGGSLTFDSSCTNGNMVARTWGKFVDSTAGATVTAEVFSQDLHQLQGLEIGAAMTVTPTSRSVAGTGITQTITGDGVTTSTVTRT